MVAGSEVQRAVIEKALELASRYFHLAQLGGDGAIAMELTLRTALLLRPKEGAAAGARHRLDRLRFAPSTNGLLLGEIPSHQRGQEEPDAVADERDRNQNADHPEENF